MSETKFKHYAIKTGENFLAKDIRTNCLEIYEDELSAERVVRRSSQDISIVPCYVYTEKEHCVFDEMYAMLEKVKNAQELADNEIEHSDNLHCLYDEIKQLLAKARGEL